MEAVITSIITGLLTLVGTIITVRASSKKTEQSLVTEMAVMHNEINNLRKEVEKHNNFAVRVPVLEQRQKDMFQSIKTLENFHME